MKRYRKELAMVSTMNCFGFDEDGNPITSKIVYVEDDNGNFMESNLNVDDTKITQEQWERFLSIED